MADAVIALEASNLFGFPADFNTTDSSTSIKRTNVQALDELGNVACQRSVGEQNEYSQTVNYCGTGFVTSMGTFLTKFGDVQNSKIVTGLTINMTAAGYVTVQATGHNHGTNAHAAGVTVGYSDVSNFLPHEATEPFVAWNGFGVPTFGVTVGSAASPSSATVTFTMDHKDANDQNGDHLVGKNTTPKCELKMDFEGIPTSNTATLLEADFGVMTNDMFVPIVDSTDSSDSNSKFDTFSFTAHANPLLATA